MTQAPASPATRELRQQYGISPETELAVIQASNEITAALNDHHGNLIAVLGGCSMTGHQGQIEAEGRRIAELGAEQEHLHLLHRIPPWKPRTKPESWHGEETTNPTGAFRTLASLATNQSNVAIELGSQAHLDRYGSMLTFGWTGSRNTHSVELIEMLAKRDPKLPLGIKNDMDGKIESALAHVALADEVRSNVDNPAPAILVYRGGQQVRTPEQWQEAYLQALEITDGKLIVDTAHGSEMAHDKDFNKSVAGQIAAIEAVIGLAERGYLPAGIMIEASDIESPVDPVIPLETALAGVKRLYEIKMNSQTASANEVIGAV